MKPHQIIEALGISERTYRRWRQRGTIPRHAALALEHVSGTIHGWPGFKVEGDWLLTPSGSRVHKEVVGNIDYFAYLQRLLGHLNNDWAPAVPKNPGDIRLIEPWMRGYLNKLGVLTHNEPPNPEDMPTGHSV
jgi:hypothetical protein